MSKFVIEPQQFCVAVLLKLKAGRHISIYLTTKLAEVIAENIILVPET